MKTRITELLGIEYPIVLAAMAWIGDADLAAAVSQAGGLGTLGPNAGQVTVTTDVYETGERLREQVRKVRSLTDRPFAVNFVVGVPGVDRQYSDRCVEVGIEERVPVAIVSQGGPKIYNQRLKDSGMKVVHTCSTVDHAKKAEQSGVDAVIVSGTEGGGHSGFHQLTTLCLVPQAADAVKIPVIAGGGIGDARGFVAALALGAEGVYMGTRFICTKECPAHPNVKQTITNARDTSTMAIWHGMPSVMGPGDRGFAEERRGSIRIIVNEHVRDLLEQQAGSATWEDMIQAILSTAPEPGTSRTADTFMGGDITTGVMSAGQIAGMINDMPSCQEFIQRMVQEAEPILERLKSSFVRL